MIKQCQICNNEFETIKGGETRQYCFECSPRYPKGGSRAQTISALRRAMKREAVKRFGGACVRCGYHKSIAALSFHHRDPAQKAFGLSGNGTTHTWDKYWEEAQKCDLLCANCHAELHEEEGYV